MKVDEIIPLLGNFGRYQFFVVTYINILSIIGCMTTLSNVFFAAESDHWCQVLPDENCTSWVEFQDNCTDAKKAVCLPPPERENSKYQYSSCEQWVIPDGYQFNPYDNLNGSRIECQNGWEYDTSQYKTTTITEFDLVCDDGGWASLAQSIYFVGFLVGSFTFGTLSDCMGRKKSAIIGLMFWAVGFIVTTFSVNIYMYAAFRFIAAFGNIGTYISLFVLVLEIVGKSYRTAVSMLAGIFFAIGYFVLATTAMYIREWRTLSLVVSLPVLILFFPAPFFQESISWLVSKGKIEEAEATIRRIAKFNKKTLPDVLFTKEDIQEQAESNESSVPPSVIDLYKTPNMAVKTINMQYNWLVNSLVYYGLSQSTGDLGVDDYWAFFVSGAVEIPALIYATFAVEKFGRKWNTAILELIGGVACLATIFIPIGIWRTVVSMIGKFCISATFSIIYLYTTELFPTPVRAVGLGLCSVAARVGGILSPIILLLGDVFEALPLILFGSSAVVAGMLALFLPETMGQKLPQTLKEGEDFGKCKCMGGGTDESIVDLEEIDASPKDGLALTNPAFEVTDEKMSEQV
ncbi:organic cation transporter protein-like [Asterias amurensis]|uniref:organic cation transporter protein-like n=1 Tax=Asterias amurensis TaxID=7602 RepID=UPI003AB7CF1C